MGRNETFNNSKINIRKYCTFSRCVVCRNGQAVELSQDHKPEDEPELKRIKNAGGKVTPDGRVNGGLNLSRAIGRKSNFINVLSVFENLAFLQVIMPTNRTSLYL